MRDGWKAVPVATVVHQVRRRVPVIAGHGYPLLGVRWYGAGPFHRETVTNETSKATQLFRVLEGDFIYNRLFAWKGSFGIIPPQLDGHFVSGEFPVFETESDLLLPQYLNLLMCRPSVWAQVERESTGSTAISRNRWKEERFLEYRIPLPPIKEQRRVVDVVGTIDDAKARASDLETTARRMTTSMRTQLVGDESWPRVPLREAVSAIEAGKSPPAVDRLPDPGERAVLKVSSVRFAQFDPSQAKTVHPTTTLPERARLQDGDVLITRANTTALVGAVCRVATAPDGYFLCDKTLRLVPRKDRIDPDYLVEALCVPEVRKQIELAATGTSASMKNISQESVLALRLTLPPLETQQEIAGLLSAFREIELRASDETTSLNFLRNRLVDDLLSGAHAIPDSYDALLESAS